MTKDVRIHTFEVDMVTIERKKVGSLFGLETIEHMMKRIVREEAEKWEGELHEQGLRPDPAEDVTIFVEDSFKNPHLKRITLECHVVPSIEPKLEVDWGEAPILPTIEENQ